MSQQTITYRVAAISEAAGKYKPDAPYDGNEDCYYIDDNVTAGQGSCNDDNIIVMGPLGCLLVVADGMGGMNAGEVASHIAIDVVRQAFSPGVVRPSDAADAESRRRYLENVVLMADRRIKEDSAVNPDHKGMGSTIILAWIVGDNLTLTWCGDSRAYRYNSATGIQPLSTDHSYVQQLVNQGIISYEDTFEHPQGNIIVRSLGDPTKTAQPETREWKLYSGDIVLLCSDGLSGVLRDKLTYDHTGVPFAGENIEDIIAANTESMVACRDALMNAARDADWYDNVTVLLCQIIEGAPAPAVTAGRPATMPPMPAKTPTAPAVKPAAPAFPENPTQAPKQVTPPAFDSKPMPVAGRKNNTPVIIAVCVTVVILALAAAAAVWYFILRDAEEEHSVEEITEQVTIEANTNGLSGSQGGLGSGSNQNEGCAPGSRPIDDKLNKLRQSYHNQVNKYANGPVSDYAAALNKEIDSADFNAQGVAESMSKRIKQLEERDAMVKEIDELLKKAEGDEASSFMELREVLVSDKYLPQGTMDSIDKAIKATKD